MIMNYLMLSVSIPFVVGHTHGHSHSLEDKGVLGAAIHFFQDFVFPFDARYNSLLATLIIQLLPCLIIYFVPGMRALSMGNNLIGPLSLLVSFAMGTLLGDIFLHLLPEVFSSIEFHDHETAHLELIRMSAAVCGGFMIFFVLEKTMRVLLIGAGSEVSLVNHTHSHSHLPSDLDNNRHNEEVFEYSHGYENDSSSSAGGSARQRKKERSSEKSPKLETSQIHKPGVSVYLNIVSGFIHNITDGVALASSFYSSKNVGVSTTIAIMFHEIPHELGDFAILVANGFTFSQAFKSQIINSIGSLTGTAIGCALNEITTSEQNHWDKLSESIYFFSKLPGLRLPLTTGGFIYIVTMGVVPQMLQTTSQNRSQELKKWLLQFIFICIGFMLMASLATN